MKINPADVVVEIRDEGDEWFIEALWQGYRIGYAECMIVSDLEVQLCNIVVENNVPVPDTFVKKLCNAFGCAFSGEDFRGNGIGSLLLDRTISESKLRGCREIWGSIIQKDQETTPFLLEWYTRHGFSILPPDKQCLRNAVQKIQLKILILTKA